LVRKRLQKSQLALPQRLLRAVRTMQARDLRHRFSCHARSTNNKALRCRALAIANAAAYFLDLGLLSSSKKVTRMVTRNSTILPFSTTAFCSETHALEIFLTVPEARVMPTCMASSNDFEELELISIIFATDIQTP
jgi:hypothetical protein